MSQTRTEELDGVRINVISAHEWLLSDTFLTDGSRFCDFLNLPVTGKSYWLLRQ